MKKSKNNFQRIIFFVFCIFYCGTLLMGYSCEANASPAFFIEKKAYDFGTILEDTQVAHDYIIENRGNKPLKILNVRSDCGCATTSYSKEILQGQNGKISIIFDSKGYGGKKVNKKIRVDTNDPKQGHFDLSITGHVDAIIIIEPDKVILTGNAGEKIEMEIFITHDKRHPLKVISAESKKGNVSVKLEEIEGSEQRKYKVKVTSLRKEKGKYSDYINLKTDSNIYPEKQIRVKGEIH